MGKKYYSGLPSLKPEWGNFLHAKKEICDETALDLDTDERPSHPQLTQIRQYLYYQFIDYD